jgi:integrase
MAIYRLTDKKLQNLPPRKTPYPDGGGVYFQVSEGVEERINISSLFGFATGEIKTSRSGKQYKEKGWMTLGKYGTRIGKTWHIETSLAEIRRNGDAARQLRREGKNPRVVRDAERAAQAAAVAKTVTFRECCDGYVADHEKGWGADHKQVWTNSIRDYVTPVFAKLPVAMVDTAMVLKVLKPIWTSKHETARRLRARIESVLDWATAHHYREGPNPVRWKGHLDQILDKTDNVHVVKHHPALPYTQIGDMMAELRKREKREGLPSHEKRDVLCLQLLILTATRVGAATGARAEEFDLAAKMWTIPPVRAKRRGKRKAMPFRVPLSDAAIKIIERVGKREGILFPSACDKSLADVLNRDGITTHGFRSSFRDWAGEQTNFPREVIEMAMGHVVGDETEEAYFRSDLFEKRAKLMQSWADHCATPAPEIHDNVTPIRQAG